MRAALYIRVSTDEQFKNGYSVPDQLRELRGRAVREGYEVVEEIIDDGYSGYFEERPGLERIYELAEDGAIDVVLATKRDRLFRRQYYRMKAEIALEETGVKFVTGNDTGNRIGDSVLDSYAEHEREEFIRRSRSGKRQKARGGETHGSGTPPYGYLYSEDRKSLVVDPVTMPVVRRMFQMVADGDTVYAVVKAFNTENVPPPKGRRWYTVSMRRMLWNDAYRGVWYYGRERVELTERLTKDGNRKRKHKLTPQDEWIAVPVPDSGIPHEIIDRARENLTKNYRPRAKAQHYYELKGLVFCEECGLRMTTYTADGYRYYICQKRRKYKPDDPDYCNGAVRSAETTQRRKRSVGLEDDVMDYVQDLISNPDRLSREIDVAIATVETRKDDSATWFKVVEKADRDRAADQEMFRAGVMTMDELTANLARYEEQRKIAEGHLAESRGQQQRVEELRATKRALLGAYATEIEYDGIRYLEPELRREIYDALQFSVLVAADGTPRFKGVADAQVIKLSRAVERHGEVSYGRLRPGLSLSKDTAVVMAEVAG